MQVRLQALAATVPNATRALLAVLSSTYFLQLALPGVRTFLGLVVAKALTQPWTFFTSTFVIDSIVELALTLGATAVLGRAVETHLGGREVFKLVLAGGLVGSAAAFVGVTAAYAVAVSRAAPNAGSGLYTPVTGFHAGVAALLVGLKLTIPESELTLLSHFPISIKTLPGVYIVFMAVSGLLAGRFAALASLAVGGTYGAWLYLRLAQPQPGGGRGTPGDDFSLASFFPAPLAPLIDRVAGTCSRVTGLAPIPGSGLAASGLGLGGAVIPGTGTADAARRRERGQRALEERLGLVEERLGLVEEGHSRRLPLSTGSGSSRNLAAMQQNQQQDNHQQSSGLDGGQHVTPSAATE